MSVDCYVQGTASTGESVTLVYYTEDDSPHLKRVESIPPSHSNYAVSHMSSDIATGLATMPLGAGMKSPGHPFQHLKGCTLLGGGGRGVLRPCSTEDPNHITLNSADHYNQIRGCRHDVAVIMPDGNGQMFSLGPEEIKFLLTHT